jgi:hypothetical protein
VLTDIASWATGILFWEDWAFEVLYEETFLERHWEYVWCNATRADLVTDAVKTLESSQTDMHMDNGKAIENVANAAKNFSLTYNRAMWGYQTHPDAIEVDLEVLEDAIRAYRQATAGTTETRKEAW